MSTLANSEDPDEMPHNVAFHQGQHYLIRQKTIFKEKIQYYLEIITFDPSINTMNHHRFIVSNQKEEYISTQRVK